MATAEWTVVGLSAVTALATTATAFAVWSQWKGSVEVEWEEIWPGMYEHTFPPRIEIQVQIRNYRKHAVRANRVFLSGIPIKESKADPELQSSRPTGENEIPIRRDVHPGEVKSFKLEVFPDWPALLEQQAKARWPKSSAALRIQISIASKARKRWQTKHSRTIEIPKDKIAKAKSAIGT